VTGVPRIAIAGDFAVNYQVSRHLIGAGVFEEVFMPDASGDDGSAVGAALLGAMAEAGTNRTLLRWRDIESRLSFQL
jgi:predicted NodU family carbamoyl transferase